MSANVPTPDIARIDAHEKVRGTARFGSDDARPGMLHAMLVPAPIVRGRITRIDTTRARALQGVHLVLTHEDLGGLKTAGYLLGGGYASQSVQPLGAPNIAHRGQGIALVVADTLETAIEAAALVRAEYATEAASAALDAPGAVVIAQADTPLPKPLSADRVKGDADAAFASAAVRVDVAYHGPPQHQNPIELLGTVAEWENDMLVVHESTQNSSAVRAGLAAQLGLPPERVRVLSPYCGGGFGQKNSMQTHTVLVAIAAQRTRRPVKFVMPRAQIFHCASFRPESRHRVRLGADASGRIVAALHEVDQQTSRHDLYPSMCTEVTASLYDVPNFRGRERLVRTDVQTPGFMRAPWEHMAAFAYECAIDELAIALGQDPVALRLAHDTPRDPLTGKPFSSRHLAACLQRGAERFGWSRRSPAPGSMVAPDGTSIGWGVAVGSYKASTAPATARLRVSDDGMIAIDVAGHEMGQGIRTAIAITVAERLGVRPEAVTVNIGDTAGTPQHLTAGSWGTATALPPARDAAERMRAALDALPGARAGQSPRESLRAAKRAFLEIEARHRAPGHPEEIHARVARGLPSALGPHYPEFASFSYAAHFVEVRIEATTRRVRVPRVVSVVDCGRVASPRTARSQVLGGVVWGIGAALREASEVDPRFGGFLNADLAEYVIPVNADIGSIDVDLIDEPDLRLNAAGVKGLGEVAMAGVAPAIVNAIHHATGRRLRALPVRIEQLL